MSKLRPPKFDWKPRAATKDVPTKSLNTKISALVDFHTFADFVPEIQDLIWRFVACHPRIIELSITSGKVKFQGKLPYAPNMMWATAGTRAIALENYVLVPNEAFVRRAEPPAPMLANAQNVQNNQHAQNAQFAPFPGWVNNAPMVNPGLPVFNIPVPIPQVPAFVQGLAAPAFTGALPPPPPPLPPLILPIAPVPANAAANDPLPVSPQATDASQIASNVSQSDPTQANDTSQTTQALANVTLADPTQQNVASQVIPAQLNPLAQFSQRTQNILNATYAATPPKRPRLRFYVNYRNGFFTGDIFKVTVRSNLDRYDKANPRCPTALVTGDKSIKISKRIENVDAAMYDIVGAYHAPIDISRGKLPPYFANITRIALDVNLNSNYPDCVQARRNISEYISIAVEDFWYTVQDRMSKFPNLKRVDLLISNIVDDVEKYGIQKYGTEVRQWRLQNVKQSDGVSFDKLGLALMEMELLCLAGSEHTNSFSKEGKMGDSKTKVWPEIQLCMEVPSLLLQWY